MTGAGEVPETGEAGGGAQRRKPAIDYEEQPGTSANTYDDHRRVTRVCGVICADGPGLRFQRHYMHRHQWRLRPPDPTGNPRIC